MNFNSLINTSMFDYIYVSTDVFLTSRASVMMQPITAQTRSVPSMSNLRREDLSWSMGTNQAPMAGVAVLSRFNCL